MAALIDYTYFVYPLQLSTADSTVQLFLGKIIDFVEDKYLPLITYDSEVTGEVDEIKKMIGYFSYAYYIHEQLRVNTELGNFNLQSDGSVKVIDTSYALERYNDALDIFNEYVTDAGDIIETYLNVMGI